MTKNNYTALWTKTQIVPSPNSTYHFTTVVPQRAFNLTCLIKHVCMYKPWTCVRHRCTVFVAGFECLQALGISNKSTFLNIMQKMWTTCASLISSVPCANMCAKRWVWRGIQFLVLADQVIVHLYICCFEVVHIWLIRGRTRELHMGPSPKWPNVKTTFAAEKTKAKQKNTGVNFMAITVNKNLNIYELEQDCKSLKFSTTTNCEGSS